MTFTEAVRTVLSKYATFSGRAGRPEFWWWVLATFLLMAVAQLIDGGLIAPLTGAAAFSDEVGQPVSILVSLAIVLPNLAVAFRRLHDTDRSGWWILIGLVPVVGFLVLLWFYIQPGTEGANRFG